MIAATGSQRHGRRISAARTRSSASRTSELARDASATDSNRLLSVTQGSASTETVTYDQHGQMDGLPEVRTMLRDATGSLRFTKNQSASTERTWYVYAGAQRVRRVPEKNNTEKWDASASAWYRWKETAYLGDLEIYRTYTAAADLEYERESLQVTDGDNRVVEAQTETVVTGTPESLLRYSLANPTMSVTVETDEEGNVIWYEEFRPFGSSAYVASQGALADGANRYRYQGKERDAETGLFYYGHRYYAPWMARWTCADPGGTVDGLNLYGFARGAPTTHRDVDGRQSVLEPPEMLPKETVQDFHERRFQEVLSEKIERGVDRTHASADALAEPELESAPPLGEEVLELVEQPLFEDTSSIDLVGSNARAAAEAPRPEGNAGMAGAGAVALRDSAIRFDYRAAAAANSAEAVADVAQLRSAGGRVAETESLIRALDASAERNALRSAAQTRLSPTGRALSNILDADLSPRGYYLHTVRRAPAESRGAIAGLLAESTGRTSTWVVRLAHAGRLAGALGLVVGLGTAAHAVAAAPVEDRLGVALEESLAFGAGVAAAAVVGAVAAGAIAAAPVTVPVSAAVLLLKAALVIGSAVAAGFAADRIVRSFFP